ncbi:MAG: NAD(P)H-hydrate dehydratase [Actinobacteria bacterium]|nr:NAD(P)H-hydrate dehydratase [Actinomycetota bacterium]
MESNFDELKGTDLNRILKGSKIAEIDSRCKLSGIESKRLMKNAGSRVAEVIKKDFANISSIKRDAGRHAAGTIVCGGGNNGGDGFVAALELLGSGIDVKIFCTGPVKKFSPDSRFYFEKLNEKYKSRIFFLTSEESGSKEAYDFFKSSITKSDFIVDAIFGTGLHGKEISGSAREIIEIINNTKNKNKKILIYAVDIPSGIDSDNAKVLGNAIKADKTVTFSCKKIGLVCYPGAYFAGKIIVTDIGIPEKYFENYEEIYEASLEWVADRLPFRKPWTYKHEVGKLLVIAGSIGLTGAATMTCEAAMRAGAGLLTLVCPWELNSIFEIKLTEVMTYPVEQTDDISIHMECLEEVIEISKKYDALAIGPGISTNPSTICLVREILKKVKKPTVLDADGLRALYGPREVESENNCDFSHVVITPHAGELASIFGREKIALEDRLDANLEIAKKYNLVSVLKGAGTLVTEPGGRTFINPTGSWALATAGTGDILTGIIGSLLAQGMSLMDAAACGAYIHGMASDMVASCTSRTSQTATDLFEGIKKVFLEIEKIKYDDLY